MSFSRLKEFFIDKKNRSILFLLILILGTVGTVVLVQQIQEWRGRAAGTTFTSPPSTYFPYGVYNEANLGASAFPAFASDLKAHHMDSVFYHNASAARAAEIGGAADAEGGINVFIGPWQELYSQWWNSSTVSVDIQTARNIAYPLVDTMRNHPSIKGINIKDDVTNANTQKLALMTQAINERDGTKPVLPTFLRDEHLDPYPAIPNQQVYMTYKYPSTVRSDYCDFYQSATDSKRGANNYAQLLRKTRQLLQLDRDGTQFWLGMQTNGKQTNYDPNSTDLSGPRTPTIEEMRMQFWQALGEDVKGMFWFMYMTELYWTGLKDNPTLYAEASDLGNRLNPLKATLLTISRDYEDKFVASTAVSLPVEHQPYASTLVSSDGTKYYAIVDNASCASQNILVHTDSFTGGQLKDVETGQIVNLDTPITLRGGDGKLFELINATKKSLPSPTPAPNIIQNGTMETNNNGAPDKWIARTGVTWDNTIAHNGIASMKFTGPTSTFFVPQSITLKPNTQYSLSYWVKTSNVTGNGIAMRFLQTSPDYILPETKQINGTTDWTQIVTTFFTPRTLVTGRVDITWFMNTGDTAWVDDVILCEGRLGCNGTFSVPSLGQPPFPSLQISPTTAVSITPTPSPAMTSPTPTPNQTTFPMPQIDPDYTKDVETWWFTHPFNPDNPSSIPIGSIQNPSPSVNVKTQFNGNIQAAIDSLSATGGTLFFDPGTYQHNNFTIIGKNNVHFVSNGGVTILGGRTETSNTYALSNSGLITTCPEAASYASFTSAVFESGNALHQTALNCIKNPVRNIYFKNIIFDGGGTAFSAIRLAVIRDVVFDNVTFQNFIPDGSFLDGMVNGAETINSVWFRSVNFKNKGEYAVYLDGLHGGGVINSRIESQHVGGFAMLTNDDYTYDYNGNGTIEQSEQRIGDYLVFYGNSFATTSYPIRATSAHTLIKNNTVDGFMLNLVNFDRKNSPIGSTHQYNFYGNRVVGNRTQNLQYLVDFGQPDCGSGACDKMGQYQIRDNIIQNAGSFIDLLSITGTLIIDGPNTQTNNCVNGNIFGTITPCNTSTTPTIQPTNTPIPTTTPVPNTTKFSTTVFLHGIGKGGDSVNPNGTGNTSPLHPSRTLTVELHENGTDNLLFSFSGTITFNTTNGNFTGVIDAGANVPSGSYIVKLKSPTFLINSYPGTLTVTSGQTLTLQALSLVAGDANGDNRLDILDYNLLLDCYSELAPPRNCNSTKLLQTDLTDDGAVNQFDYNLFLRELSVQSGR